VPKGLTMSQIKFLDGGGVSLVIIVWIGCHEDNFVRVGSLSVIVVAL
jgi:hypothetical protein